MFLLLAEAEPSWTGLVVLLGVIFIGIPFVMLSFNVIRRLMELHKLMHPVGTLFITDDNDMYLELDDDSVIKKPYGTVVLRVNKARSKRSVK